MNSFFQEEVMQNSINFHSILTKNNLFGSEQVKRILLLTYKTVTCLRVDIYFSYSLIRLKLSLQIAVSLKERARKDSVLANTDKVLRLCRNRSR